MKVIGYTRVSSQRQAKEGLSLEAQKQKIKAYCEFRGLELVDIISDEGLSGGKASRPGYQSLLSLCKSGAVQGIVIYSLSRFTRSTKDLINFLDSYVIKGKTELHSISENLDTSSAMGRCMIKIIGALNELEREQTGERTSSIFDFKRTKGEKLGGLTPFGYEVDEQKRLIENSNEQAIIRQVLSLKEQGFNCNQIARRLNEQGCKTKKGKIWNYAQVQRIIKRAA